MVRICNTSGENGNTHPTLVARPEEDLLEDFQSRWEDNIKTDLESICCEDVRSLRIGSPDGLF
jgi:hypothetical protein